MAYADYTYYTDTYLGNILEEEAFPRLALRASAFLDCCTQGRAAKHKDMEALKMACCAIAEQVQALDNANALARESLSKSLAKSSESDGGEVKSETVGAHSVTWQSGSESAVSAFEAVKALEAQLSAIALRYLAGTGLIYRGGRPLCTHLTQ